MFNDREASEAPPLGQPLGHKRFYTTEQLGEKQSVTPDGFLLCQDTPIARIGQQVYGEHELPGMRGKGGLIAIHRDADEVFRPATIASFHGKPVTNDHPTEKVTPHNYKMYAVGTVLNPHQGDGVQFDRDFLYADLLIHDPQAIADIRSGKREVSAGYDAEYEQTGDGEGRQHSIVGNHVALVNRGRCGPLCSIGDEDMATRLRVNDGRRRIIRDGLLSAFHSRDERAFHDQLEELAKVPELLGEQVSGESSGGEGHTGDTHVSINLGGGGAPAGRSGGGMVMGDEPDDPDPASNTLAPANPSANPNAALEQRLDRIEQALVLIAKQLDGGNGNGNGDEPDNGEQPDNGDRRFGDRRGRTRDRRTRDDEPTEPPTEEPNEDPGQDLPYGSGTEGQQFEAPQLGTEDRRRGTRDRRRLTGDQQGTRQQFIGDSTSLRNEFHETLARAELLMPGLSVPTFDAARTAQTTQEALCGVRRNALTAAWRDQGKQTFIGTLLGGKPANFTQMSCDAVRMVFDGASELVRQANNHDFGRVRPNNQGVRGGSRALTPAEINERNRALYNIH